MLPPIRAKLLDRQPAGSNELLTIAEAARLLGISATSMRRLQQGRRIPFFKVGRCIRFSSRDIVAYLAKRRIEAVG